MATAAAHPTSQLNGGLIDPTKQAEYPILLGSKLAGKGQYSTDKFIGITYNHKTKSSSRHQRATITATGSTQHQYKLTLQDKSHSAEHKNLVYTYHGSVDPTSLVSESETSNLVLVFDPEQKAFVLEPVSTRLNFNLRSAPGKSTQQVIEQYPQLNVLSGEDQISCDDQLQERNGEDDAEGAADESNPYDFRHFLPKPKAEIEGPDVTTPDALPNLTNSYLAPPPVASARSKPKPIAKAKAQANPLRQQKRQPKVAAADNGPTISKPKSATRVGEVDICLDSSSSDREETAKLEIDVDKPSQPAASPGANIIVDGD
ncbi:EAF superfamily domain-containing protein [Histoplasma ohiense]|nr:EAF superfamily domain-containing protein [Histoplasma ohiense (nom. inval.)]